MHERAHSGQAVDRPPRGHHRRMALRAPTARPGGRRHVASPSASKAAHNGPVRRQAAYLRVSTAQQSEALQREAIERAAAARGEKIDLWVAEKASGKRVDRPELDSLRVL